MSVGSGNSSVTPFANTPSLSLIVVSGAPTVNTEMKDKEGIAYIMPEIRDLEMLIVGSIAFLVVTPHYCPLPSTRII